MVELQQCTHALYRIRPEPTLHWPEVSEGRAADGRSLTLWASMRMCRPRVNHCKPLRPRALKVSSTAAASPTFFDPCRLVRQVKVFFRSFQGVSVSATTLPTISTWSFWLKGSLSVNGLIGNRNCKPVGVVVGKKLANDSDGALGGTYSALAVPPSVVGLGLAWVGFLVCGLGRGSDDSDDDESSVSSSGSFGRSAGLPSA
jgi:hypothetical protein